MARQLSWVDWYSFGIIVLLFLYDAALANSNPAAGGVSDGCSPKGLFACTATDAIDGGSKEAASGGIAERGVTVTSVLLQKSSGKVRRTVLDNRQEEDMRRGSDMSNADSQTANPNENSTSFERHATLHLQPEPLHSAKGRASEAARAIKSWVQIARQRIRDAFVGTERRSGYSGHTLKILLMVFGGAILTGVLAYVALGCVFGDDMSGPLVMRGGSKQNTSNDALVGAPPWAHMKAREVDMRRPTQPLPYGPTPRSGAHMPPPASGMPPPAPLQYEQSGLSSMSLKQSFRPSAAGAAAFPVTGECGNDLVSEAVLLTPQSSASKGWPPMGSPRLAGAVSSGLASQGWPPAGHPVMPGAANSGSCRSTTPFGARSCPGSPSAQRWSQTGNPVPSDATWSGPTDSSLLDALCPELVVPHGSECTLQVPTLDFTSTADRTATVDDVGGEPVFRATFGADPLHPHVSRTPARRCLQLSSAEGELVFGCAREKNGPGPLALTIYDHSEQPYGVLSLVDVWVGGTSFVLTPGRAHCKIDKIHFKTDTGSRSFEAKTDDGQLLAILDAGGNGGERTFIIGPCVDAGLLLLCLLGIDWLRQDSKNMQHV